MVLLKPTLKVTYEHTDIIKDLENFLKPSTVCKSKELKTVHKPAIVDENIKQLYKSGVVDSDKPGTLQNKVFLKILFFCRRVEG